MPTSDWVCRACGTKTAASSEVCGGCGVRTFAHGAELVSFTAGNAAIVTQQAEIESEGAQVREPQAQSPVQKLLNRHLWVKRGIALLLYALAGCAAAVYWFSPDLIYVGLGIAALAVAIFLASVLGIELNSEVKKSKSSESPLK